MLNLIVTHCLFCDDESLTSMPAFAKLAGLDGAGTNNCAGWHGMIAREQAASEADDDGLTFYAIGNALHRLRGPLGAAHLFADTKLAARVERFLASAGADLDPILPKFSVAVRDRLRYAAVPID
jgi:hypothetical protein